MKKLMIILMCVLFASAAFAQFDLGIKLGANYSYIESEEFDFQGYVDEFSDMENITGFVGGGFAMINLGSFAVQGEALFSMEGFSIEGILEGEGTDVIDNTTIRTNYLNGVVLGRYNIDLAIVKPFVIGGFNVGIPLGDPEVYGQGIEISDFDFTKMGLVFGAGVKAFDMVELDVRFVKRHRYIHGGNK
ncbi:MAG: porin family protein [Candidatus Marinimicrobia bacterium]|nr:porin family protein [Candidatus Neomarinimicrobiota bacterium]